MVLLEGPAHDAASRWMQGRVAAAEVRATEGRTTSATIFTRLSNGAVRSADAPRSEDDRFLVERDDSCAQYDVR